jgi:uncharacterized integral membrane protein
MEPLSKPARTSPSRAAEGASTTAAPTAAEVPPDGPPIEAAGRDPGAPTSAGRESATASGARPEPAAGDSAAPLEAEHEGRKRPPAAGQTAHARVEREFVGTGWFWSLIIGSLLALAAVIFVLQNSDSVEVKFLGWSGDVSLAGIVLVVALGAIVADELFGVVYRRRRRRRLNERASLRSAHERATTREPVTDTAAAPRS